MIYVIYVIYVWCNFIVSTINVYPQTRACVVVNSRDVMESTCIQVEHDDGCGQLIDILPERWLSDMNTSRINIHKSKYSIRDHVSAIVSRDVRYIWTSFKILVSCCFFFLFLKIRRKYSREGEIPQRQFLDLDPKRENFSLTEYFCLQKIAL